MKIIQFDIGHKRFSFSIIFLLVDFFLSLFSISSPNFTKSFIELMEG